MKYRFLKSSIFLVNFIKSYKAQTSVLMDEHDIFQSFGFKAEEDYNQAKEKKTNNYAYIDISN